MQIRSGDFCYELEEEWGIAAKQKWPDIKEIPGITIDKQDNVYLLTRTQPPVIQMNRKGEILDCFGEGVFVRPHGMYLSSKGEIFGVDDRAHTVYRFDAEHRLISTLGNRNQPSDTGWTEENKTVLYSGKPFNRPTRMLVDDGMLYVTDGYRNACVHKFDDKGQLVKSWGTPGEGEGQFNLPHGIAIDRDKILYVADRQNHRIQRFTTEGKFIDQWGGFHRPSDVWIDSDQTVYVAECKRTSDFGPYPSRVSILNRQGDLLARFECDAAYDPAIGSRCAHGIAVDSEGNLFIAEVGKLLKNDFFGVYKFRRV